MAGSDGDQRSALSTLKQGTVLCVTDAVSE